MGNYYFIADITIPPQAVNVSVNGVAEFNCTAVADTCVWKANEDKIDEREGVKINLTSIMPNSTTIRLCLLKLTVTSTDNATNISCTAVKRSPFTNVKSPSVLLHVQGSLENMLCDHLYQYVHNYRVSLQPNLMG